MKMTPNMWKAAYIALAAGIYLVSAAPFAASVRDPLIGLAGMLVGGGLIRRPGDA